MIIVGSGCLAIYSISFSRTTLLIMTCTNSQAQSTIIISHSSPYGINFYGLICLTLLWSNMKAVWRQDWLRASYNLTLGLYYFKLSLYEGIFSGLGCAIPGKMNRIFIWRCKLEACPLRVPFLWQYICPAGNGALYQATQKNCILTIFYILSYISMLHILFYCVPFTVPICCGWCTWVKSNNIDRSCVGWPVDLLSKTLFFHQRKEDFTINCIFFGWKQFKS